MIVVTDDLSDLNWSQIYGIHYLGNSVPDIPWYIKIWHKDYYSRPDFVPTVKGVYGNPLSSNAHRLRMAVVGETWNETPSNELLSLLKQYEYKTHSHIGDDPIDEQDFIKILNDLH